MADVVLVDAGPLVALMVDDDEEHHARAAEKIRILRCPVRSCGMVVSEASVN